MKKLLTLITTSLLIPAFAFASSGSLAPASIAVNAGQSFSVNIVIDPQGTAYTAKVALSFDPNLLYASSFTQASGWISLSQPGYDSVDNSSGSLVKTAGATGGFSAPKVFGTVTFTARANGVANVAFTGATQVLDSNNTNTFTGGSSASVSITAPTPVVVPVQTPPVQKPANPPRNILKSSTVTPISSTPTATTTATTTEIVTTSQTAQAAKASPNLPWNIILPIITLAIGFALGRQKFA